MRQKHSRAGFGVFFMIRASAQADAGISSRPQRLQSSWAGRLMSGTAMPLASAGGSLCGQNTPGQVSGVFFYDSGVCAGRCRYLVPSAKIAKLLGRAFDVRNGYAACVSRRKFMPGNTDTGQKRIAFFPSPGRSFQKSKIFFVNLLTAVKKVVFLPRFKK